MDRQVPFGVLLQELGGEKGGQGLRMPIAIRPPSPLQAPGTGKSPLEGGPSGAALSIGGRSEPPPKRKRGRPRKYTGDSSPGATTESLFSALAKKIAAPYTPPPYSSAKRGRGRPPGSTKKQQLANMGIVLTGTGKSFTSHVLTVNTGEDVSSKIMQFALHGSRAMCVLSANGAVSNVMLRQGSSTGGTVTYEGRYEILSLSGSYLPTDGDGARSRTGSISVSLAGSDGRVFGGGVAGTLMAASPIQLVVGSFLLGPSKPDTKPSVALTPVPQPHPEAKTELRGSALASHVFLSKRELSESSVLLSVFGSPSLNGARAQKGPQAPSGRGQPSEQRPQALGVFQPSEGWGVAPHAPFLGDNNRRADINIPLAGG